MIIARNAALLNFSGNSYHWGCFGTSMEIYQTLLERNYYPTCVGVEETHLFPDTPANLAQMIDPAFMRQALDRHTLLRVILQQADAVIVNGEGTLHGDSPGPRNLMFFMALASLYLGKPVHLINHCFYPSDDLSHDSGRDDLYRTIAQPLKTLVPRDELSLKEIIRLGLKAKQGFDCLPRFIARHNIKPPLIRRGIMLSGVVKMAPETAKQIAALAAPRRKFMESLLYLTGAKGFPANEDPPTFQAMQEAAPDLRQVNAAGMRDWLAAIAGARILVSGRFHHSLAAIMLGTPVITFPSNTPKISAICAMLGLETPIPYNDPDFAAKLTGALDRVNQGAMPTIDKAARQKLLSLAEQNFAAL